MCSRIIKDTSLIRTLLLVSKVICIHLDKSACIFVELKDREKDADYNSIISTITKKYRELINIDECCADISGVDITGVIPPVFVVSAEPAKARGYIKELPKKLK